MSLSLIKELSGDYYVPDEWPSNPKISEKEIRDWESKTIELIKNETKEIDSEYRIVRSLMK